MAHATASDVTVRWARSATPDETALIEVRLEDVERMIVRRIPDLETLLGDTIDEADLIQVESDAVLRLVRNPEGYLSETDGNYTYMLTQDLATGRLAILPEEWEILGLLASGMFVIVPVAVMPT